MEAIESWIQGSPGLHSNFQAYGTTQWDLIAETRAEHKNLRTEQTQDVVTLVGFCPLSVSPGSSLIALLFWARSLLSSIFPAPAPIWSYTGSSGSIEYFTILLTDFMNGLVVLWLFSTDSWLRWPLQVSDSFYIGRKLRPSREKVLI